MAKTRPATSDNIDGDPRYQQLMAGIARIEKLTQGLIDDRADLSARLNAATVRVQKAIATATRAINDFDHSTKPRQQHTVHDGLVDTLAHLRAIHKLLTKEVPSRTASSN